MTEKKNKSSATGPCARQPALPSASQNQIESKPAIETEVVESESTSMGVSSEAHEVEGLVRQSVQHFLEPRLRLLIPEILSLRDDSGGKTPDWATIRAAIKFAYCLPRFAPIPEVSVDPDGEISFDWLSLSGELFSVSVNKQNQLAYAGWFGEKSRIHGIEQLAESCPEEIVRAIQKATARGQQSERYQNWNARCLQRPN